MLEYFIQNSAAAVLTVGLLYAAHTVWAFLSDSDDGRMDDATKAYLSAKNTVPEGQCSNMVHALETAPFTEDEATCAEQMRAIVLQNHIPYSSLIDSPETLLRVSEGHVENGALWTRFTVQYNLYAGSIVALGSDRQRRELVASQGDGALGCFAFTEKGAGVLSGAGVETTATYDPETDEFVINSPTASSSKNWISQGMYAESAVILAELIIDGESKGPHLFWSRIAERSVGLLGKKAAGRPSPLPGVAVDSLPEKTALKGLDNATVYFSNFRVPRSALLDRFCSFEPAASGGKCLYATKLPAGVPRMLDLLIFRLLTGRIVLSEATTAMVLARLRRSWSYCAARELWRGRKPEGAKMAAMPLTAACFRDYGRSLAVVAAFIADTREVVADSIRQDRFTYDTVEATCMCKFLGTGFGVDAASAVRKTMGARALQHGSGLGAESFLPNATSAAEGDNTIMELKVVQDAFRGRTPKVPFALMWRTCGTSAGRRASGAYVSRLAKAVWLGKRALKDGQLLKDMAWARAHLRVVAVWLGATKGQPGQRAWLESYGKVLVRFPAPLQC